MVSVNHQIDIRSDRFTHGGAGLDVHFRVWRKRDGRHPGVQFDGFVSARHQGFGKARVLVRRRQTARQIVPAHGAAVSRNFIAVTAEQFPHRHIQFATNQIPQCLLNEPEGSLGELMCAPALPVRQFLPDFFAVERILADQHFAKEGIDYKRAHHFRRRKSIPFSAIVRRNTQHCHFGHAFRAWVRMPGAVGDPSRRILEDGDVYRFYFHYQSLKLQRFRATS
ncbi:hypothetical protein D3C76_1050450 [compost metagenome]